ncbi:efflux RND transporter periplasmic adaptor subunit [Polycyclovorans algicola]|uniref:efflux RND transporter periplasmic adaptor subunit n=1 Tax=Polycyclovorans algicola TaxID=616992 RepID=UPI0009FF7604|nr:efflux RND transporter periplasmic adaptor subunit [Polycyclovorans algicola]
MPPIPFAAVSQSGGFFIRRAATLVMLASVALAGCGGDAASQEDDASPPKASVRAETVATRDVEVTGTYPGRARGAREVQVRARVDGILEERTYDEGAEVEAGARLFRIDPRPYRIAVQRAEAGLAEATAVRNEARRQWDRVENLFDQDAVSARERDLARSELELADAQRQTAAANLADARLDLGYTDVTAPISGVTGLEAVPEGTLLARGDLLTQVTQLDPIHLRFSFPESALPTHSEGDSGDDNNAPPLTLILNDGSEYDRPGKIDFTNAGVDAATGSISARAIFPNPDGVIRPGQFLRVRVQLDALDDVVTVPEEAIAQGADGPQVFLTKEGRAVATAVELGPVVDGAQVISKGLKGGERLIVSGLSGLKDDAEVREADAEEDDGEDDGVVAEGPR